jgi:hypothetical protein
MWMPGPDEDEPAAARRRGGLIVRRAAPDGVAQRSDENQRSSLSTNAFPTTASSSGSAAVEPIFDPLRTTPRFVATRNQIVIPKRPSAPTRRA